MREDKVAGKMTRTSKHWCEVPVYGNGLERRGRWVVVVGGVLPSRHHFDFNSNKEAAGLSTHEAKVNTATRGTIRSLTLG